MQVSGEHKVSTAEEHVTLYLAVSPGDGREGSGATVLSFFFHRGIAGFDASG